MAAACGRTRERWSESAISPTNTASVKAPNRTDVPVGFDFSNDRITAVATKEDAIEALVMNGVSDLR
jgi:hypothetical protein